MRLDAEPLILQYLWTHEHTSLLWYWYLNVPWYTVNLSGSCSCSPILCRMYGVVYAVWYVAKDCLCGACCISLPYGQKAYCNQSQLWACLYDWQIESCPVRLSQMVLPLGVSLRTPKGVPFLPVSDPFLTLTSLVRLVAKRNSPSQKPYFRSDSPCLFMLSKWKYIFSMLINTKKSNERSGYTKLWSIMKRKSVF